MRQTSTTKRTNVTWRTKCTSRMLRNSRVLNVLRMATGAGTCGRSQESVTVIAVLSTAAQNGKTLRRCDNRCECIWNMSFICLDKKHVTLRPTTRAGPSGLAVLACVGCFGEGRHGTLNFRAPTVERLIPANNWLRENGADGDDDRTTMVFHFATRTHIIGHDDAAPQGSFRR